MDIKNLLKIKKNAKLLNILLAKNHYTIATAESCTGGMLASTIIGESGASGIINSSIVTYSNDAKIKYTGVKPNLWQNVLKPFISAFACGLSTVILNLNFMGRIGTVLEIAVAAVVYFVVLILLNTFEAEDVITLPKGDKILKLFTKLKIIR